MPAFDATRVRWSPLVLVPLVLAAWVYYPVTGVFFWADDFYHLGRLNNENPWIWVITPFGGHSLILRNLAFLASWRLFGFDSGPWYWTSLLTHLLNVGLLFSVLRSLTRSAGLACVGATVWGICPLAVATIGWYAVYGQAMAATLMLLVLADVGRLAERGESVTRGRAWAWYGLLLLGTTCFGTGIGVAMVFPAVLFLLLPVAWRQRRIRLAYLALPLVTVLLYVGARAIADRFEPLAFSEKMQHAMVMNGIWAAPLMLIPLLGVAIGATALGHWFVPARFVDGPTVTACVLFVLGLGVTAWRGDARVRRTAMAMLILAIGIYGVLAVGRAGPYAVFNVPFVRAASEPRYHYLGTIPVVVLACLALRETGRLGRLVEIPRALLLAAGLALPVLAYASSSFKVEQHVAARKYVTQTMREIVDSVAAAPPGSTVYIENGVTNLVIGGWLEQFLPGRAGLFLFLSPEQLPPDRQVRFIERDQNILDYWALRPHSRLATLLVPPPPERPGGG